VGQRKRVHAVVWECGKGQTDTHTDGHVHNTFCLAMRNAKRSHSTNLRGTLLEEVEKDQRGNWLNQLEKKRKWPLHGNSSGVSEQFLNGTSAHYRLFSAKKG